MSSVNKVFLIGRLGKDPEMRYTKDQTPFARFSLATSEVFTVNGERREKTQWHQLVAWRKTAEIAGRYLKKGKQIFVEGKIEYREFEDQSGQRRFFTDIIVDRLTMLGSAQDGGYGAPQGGYGAPQGGYGGAPQGGHGGAPQGGYGGAPQGGYGGAPQGGQTPPEPGGFGEAAPQGEQGGPGGGAYSPPSSASPKGPEPMNYGEPTADVPESDDFNDDDIPF